jgi:hypothetical protein
MGFAQIIKTDGTLACILLWKSRSTARQVDEILRATEFEQPKSFFEILGLPSSPSRITEAHAASDLKKLGPPAIQPLIDAAKDKSRSGNIHSAAVAAIAEFDDPRAADFLTGLLEDSPPGLSDALKVAVHKGNRAVTDGLIRVLTALNAQATGKETAAWCLAGSSDPKIREVLISQLEAGDGKCRQFVIAALSWNDWGDDALGRVLRNGHPADQIAAAYYCAAFGKRQMLEPMEAALPSATGPVAAAFQDSIASLRAQRAFATYRATTQTSQKAP